jgi:hypothetical protein
LRIEVPPKQMVSCDFRRSTARPDLRPAFDERRQYKAHRFVFIVLSSSITATSSPFPESENAARGYETATSRSVRPVPDRTCSGALPNYAHGLGGQIGLAVGSVAHLAS